MSLEAKRRFVGARQPLQRAIEQADMRRSQVGGQGFFINRKAMVLAGDADASRIEVFHRMVGAMVTKLHLEGFGPAGQRHDLVA